MSVTDTRRATVPAPRLICQAGPVPGPVALRFDALAERVRVSLSETHTGEQTTPAVEAATRPLRLLLDEAGVRAALCVELLDELPQPPRNAVTSRSVAALLAIRELLPGLAERLYLEDIVSLCVRSGAVDAFERHLVHAALLGGICLAPRLRGEAPSEEGDLPLHFDGPSEALVLLRPETRLSAADWTRHEQRQVPGRRARGGAERRAHAIARLAQGTAGSLGQVFASVDTDEALLATLSGLLPARQAALNAGALCCCLIDGEGEVLLSALDEPTATRATDAFLGVLDRHCLQATAHGWLVEESHS